MIVPGQLLLLTYSFASQYYQPVILGGFFPQFSFQKSRSLQSSFHMVSFQLLVFLQSGTDKGKHDHCRMNNLKDISSLSVTATVGNRHRFEVAVEMQRYLVSGL